MCYAVEELDGTVTIGPLYDAFKGRISKYALEDQAREWKRRGWLAEPEHDTNGHKTGRQITQKLAGLARVPLSGHITPYHP